MKLRRNGASLSGRWLPGLDRDALSRLGSHLMLATFFGLLIGSIVWKPGKRNIEVLAAIVFLGIVLVADPFRALLFTIILIPFPAYTSVGSTSMLLILAVSGLVLMKAKQMGLHSPFVRKDADLAVMGFMLMVLLSMYVQPAVAAGEAWLLLFGLLSAVILYYMVIYLCTSPQRLWRCIEYSQYVLLVLALLGLYQWVYPDKQLLPEFFSFSRRVADMEEIRRGDVRVTATFNGQELFAEYLALCAILQYILFRRARGAAAKTYWLVSVLLVLGALFATATRGGLIVLVGGFLYMIVVGGRVIPRFQMMKVVILAMALFYLSYELIGPLVSFMIDRILSIGATDSSIQSRSVVLPQAFRAIADSPFLGHGIAIPSGTFTGGVSKNIHNLYVTLAYTIGIPGLVAFIWLCVSLFRASWQASRSANLTQDLRELGLGLNVMLVMFLVDEIKIEFTREPLTMHLTWMFFAWHVAVWRLSRQPRVTAASFV